MKMIINNHHPTLNKWAGPDYKGRWAIILFISIFMNNNYAENDHHNYHYHEDYHLALNKWAGPDHKGRWAMKDQQLDFFQNIWHCKA